MSEEVKIEKIQSRREWHNFSSFRLFVIISVLIIFGNLIFLDILLLARYQSDNTKRLPVPNLSVTQVDENNTRETVANICPQSCVSQIREATASFKPEVSIIEITPTETISQSSVKEFFIPFGSGSGFENEWHDIEGLQAYIDSGNFNNIKKITFEATVRIPTGNQTSYVRLYNKTGNHPVWFSEVSITGGTPQLLISDPITLDSGNNLYQVQMKTQLQFLTILDQARIHIITN